MPNLLEQMSGTSRRGLFRKNAFFWLTLAFLTTKSVADVKVDDRAPAVTPNAVDRLAESDLPNLVALSMGGNGAAERDDGEAMIAMAASILQKGSGPEERKFAKRWFELAFENGNAQAGYFLAYLACADENVPVDNKQIIEWLIVSSARGYDLPNEALELFDDGKSWKEAFHYIATTPDQTRYYARGKYWSRKNKYEKGFYPIYQPIPTYPSTLRLAEIEGHVTAEYIVGKDGRVEWLVIRKSDHPEFSRAVMRSLMKSTFSPGVKNGKLVKFRAVQTFDFKPNRHGPKLNEALSGKDSK